METQKLKRRGPWKETEIFTLVLNELKDLDKTKTQYFDKFYNVPKNRKELREFTTELSEEMRKMSLGVELLIFDTGCIRSEIVFSAGSNRKSLVLKNVLGCYNSMFVIKMFSHNY